MPANALVDTGPLIALVDDADDWHEACVAAYDTLRLPLLSSEAVLTELFHLVDRRAARKAWRLARSGIITLGSITDADLPALDALMLEYADRPMDFADATLVHLARRERISTVFTIDHDDFETYRLRGRTKFRIVPART